MNFTRVEPNGHYSTLHFVSEEGKWEFGLSLGPTGLRLRMGKSGRPPRLLDFCLGQDPVLYGPVTMAVLARLEAASEDSSEKTIDCLFPWAGTRPDLALHLQPLLAASGSGMLAAVGAGVEAGEFFKTKG